MHHNRNICCVCIGIFDGDETRTVCAACAHPQGACSFQIYDLHILVLGTYNKCCVQSVKVLAKFKHSRVVVETLLICLPQLGNVIGLTWNCMRFSMCFLFLCFLFLSLPSVLSAHLCARLATNFKLFNVSIVRLV
jgi:hypothetical protein